METREIDLENCSENLRREIASLCELRDEFREEFEIARRDFLKDRSQSVITFMTSEYLLYQFYQYVGKIYMTKLTMTYDFGFNIVYPDFVFMVILGDKPVLEVSSDRYVEDILLGSDDFCYHVIHKNVNVPKVKQYLMSRLPSFFEKIGKTANSIFNVIDKQNEKAAKTRSFISSFCKS